MIHNFKPREDASESEFVAQGESFLIPLFLTLFTTVR